jgi:hypothetical protein
VPFPHLAKKAAPGGHGSKRPVDWLPGPESLARLDALNRLDLALFAWARGRAEAKLQALNASVVAQGRAPFPPLTETGALAP